MAIIRDFYTRMHMPELICDLDLINYKTTHDNHVSAWLTTFI
jgi:hypothetical protein